ncbi:MAG: CHAT domain-containing tetratricopeptide repeat protein [Pyrinomonadaceae bacterium]
MRRVDLAKRLVFANGAAERTLLLSDNAQLADKKLADEIRAICYSSWTVEPLTAQKAAAAIKLLAKASPTNEIQAAALWVAGIAAITKGRFESAAYSLDQAVSILRGIGQPQDAAQAQVAQLLALAMLGRYDEAIATGRSALSVFLKAGDHLDAGKTAKNLSNILSRQNRHAEAIKYCRDALSYFIKAKEKGGQAMAENGLANTFAELNDFKKAEKYYERALTTARSQKMLVTEAEIEASLGNLALLRGRYSAALKFLESSRQKYDRLGMPHQSAIADLEIADIYSELNLFVEASEIYARIAPVFTKLKMHGEEARSRMNYARCLEKLGKDRLIIRELNKAKRLFELEKNSSGQASTLLAMAEFEIGHKHFKKALLILAEASKLIERAENPRHIISLKLLQARAFVGNADLDSAVERYTEASRFARKHNQINSHHSALNGLGQIAALRGEKSRASSFYSRSIEAVEGLRSSLSSDEFSRSFLASRLDPYEGLAELYIAEGRFADAFSTVERGRSRSLLDSIDVRTPRSAVPKNLADKEREVRAELDFHYKKLATSADDEIGKVRADVQRLETELANISRQIDSLVSGRTNRSELFDVAALQRRLSASRTLVEFVETNGSLAAFVITGGKVEFVPGLGTIAETEEKLDDLHFQFGALRYGGAAMSRFAGQFKIRTDRVLQQLYDQLLRPLEEHLAGGELITVPVGPLNYVPFHALHNGTQYVLQQFEVGYAPSAAIWMKLQKKNAKISRTALLMAFADEKIPLVESEICEIGKILPKAASFAGEAATVQAFFANAVGKDVIHLACHGQFRPDNPLFSSLHLADGWITVRDMLAKRLDASLVTLSACETGRNKIFAGDEILGLARGFLSAGASAIIVSLWNVNDAATSGLMGSLYSHLMGGEMPGGSLRNAQIEMIEQGSHPFFWSPFIKIGR